jgi:hypothetical protein
MHSSAWLALICRKPLPLSYNRFLSAAWLGVALHGDRTMQKDTHSTSRAAYSPAEFAASCGKHPTWAYRLLYSGKVKAITELGRILIPASELDRIMGFAKPYDPQPRKGGVIDGIATK